ncbi:MAG: S16 family serine protease [Acidimicrobiia bacterium]
MTAEHPPDEGARPALTASSPTVAQAPERKISPRRKLAIAFVVVVALGLVAAGRFDIPYYALSPGSIRETEPLIQLGAGTPDPDAGSISFATVAVEGRLNLLQALSGWWDPTIDVVDEDLILGGRTQQQSDEVNQVLMNDSKELAIQLALTKLELAEPAGAVVTGALQPGGPGDGDGAAALSAGDVIVSVDAVPVRSAVEVLRAVDGLAVGAEVVLEIERAVADERGAIHTAGVDRPEPTVERAVLVDHDGRAALPYQLRDAYRTSYTGEVDIDSGQVGGPSAGLAFTLGIIDELTEGDLTGGFKVAATGTIDLQGEVGPIGGIQQKATAASRAGVELFLVPDSLPPSELAAAKELGKGVELVEVGSLDEALDALAAHRGNEAALPALRA